MIIEDTEVSKISPALSPETQFQMAREEKISSHLNSLSGFQERISELGENVPDQALHALKTYKGLLVDCYFSLPYLKKYIEWNYKELADPVITPLDVLNISKYLCFSLRDEAVNIYIYSVFDIEYFFKLRDDNIDHPERVEKPLPQSEIDIYTYFLNNAFKPALLDLISNMREGKYRPLETIMKEENEAFDKWYANSDNEELHKLYDKLLAERLKTQNDFRKLIQKYLKECKFREKLPNGSGKSPFNIEKVFKTSSIEFPLDKVNKNIWGLSDMIPSDGSIITFGMESRTDKRKGREVDLMYSIDFTALEESEAVRITKKLTPFDKRVYTAIGALFNAGNTVISLSQIYTAMGNTGRPPKSTLDKINDSITKMLRAVIYISNEPEAKVYNYPRFVYDGSLLPMERISNVNINGKTTEVAIHILREPPMISFAKNHGNQLTAVPIKLLQSPISKTDNNLQIEEYLIERIAKAKKGSLSNKILMSSIYEGANITDTKQKQRLPEKLIRYLDHYKKENFIKGYSMSPDSVTINI